MILDFNKGVTKISKAKDYWYIFIPKMVQQQLQRLGVEQGHLVVWESIEEREGVVYVTLKIIRTGSIQISRQKVVRVEKQ